MTRWLRAPIEWCVGNAIAGHIKSGGPVCLMQLHNLACERLSCSSSRSASSARSNRSAGQPFVSRRFVYRHTPSSGLIPGAEAGWYSRCSRGTRRQSFLASLPLWTPRLVPDENHVPTQAAEQMAQECDGLDLADIVARCDTVLAQRIAATGGGRRRDGGDSQDGLGAQRHHGPPIAALTDRAP